MQNSLHGYKMDFCPNCSSKLELRHFCNMLNSPALKGSQASFPYNYFAQVYLKIFIYNQSLEKTISCDWFHKNLKSKAVPTKKLSTYFVDLP